MPTELARPDPTSQVALGRRASIWWSLDSSLTVAANSHTLVSEHGETTTTNGGEGNHQQQRRKQGHPPPPKKVLSFALNCGCCCYFVFWMVLLHPSFVLGGAAFFSSVFGTLLLPPSSLCWCCLLLFLLVWCCFHSLFFSLSQPCIWRKEEAQGCTFISRCFRLGRHNHPNAKKRNTAAPSVEGRTHEHTKYLEEKRNHHHSNRKKGTAAALQRRKKKPSHGEEGSVLPLGETKVTRHHRTERVGNQHHSTDGVLDNTHNKMKRKTTPTLWWAGVAAAFHFLLAGSASLPLSAFCGWCAFFLSTFGIVELFLFLLGGGVVSFRTLWVASLGWWCVPSCFPFVWCCFSFLPLQRGAIFFISSLKALLLCSLGWSCFLHPFSVVPLTLSALLSKNTHMTNHVYVWKYIIPKQHTTKPQRKGGKHTTRTDEGSRNSGGKGNHMMYNCSMSLTIAKVNDNDYAKTEELEPPSPEYQRQIRDSRKKKTSS